MRVLNFKAFFFTGPVWHNLVARTLCKVYLGHRAMLNVYPWRVWRVCVLRFSLSTSRCLAPAPCPGLSLCPLITTSYPGALPRARRGDEVGAGGSERHVPPRLHGNEATVPIIVTDHT